MSDIIIKQRKALSKIKSKTCKLISEAQLSITFELTNFSEALVFKKDNILNINSKVQKSNYSLVQRVGETLQGYVQSLNIILKQSLQINKLDIVQLDSESVNSEDSQAFNHLKSADLSQIFQIVNQTMGERKIQKKANHLQHLQPIIIIDEDEQLKPIVKDIIIDEDDQLQPILKDQQTQGKDDIVSIRSQNSLSFLKSQIKTLKGKTKNAKQDLNSNKTKNDIEITLVEKQELLGKQFIFDTLVIDNENVIENQKQLNKKNNNKTINNVTIYQCNQCFKFFEDLQGNFEICKKQNSPKTESQHFNKKCLSCQSGQKSNSQNEQKNLIYNALAQGQQVDLNSQREISEAIINQSCFKSCVMCKTLFQSEEEVHLNFYSWVNPENGLLLIYSTKCKLCDIQMIKLAKQREAQNKIDLEEQCEKQLQKLEKPKQPLKMLGEPTKKAQKQIQIIAEEPNQNKQIIKKNDPFDKGRVCIKCQTYYPEKFKSFRFYRSEKNGCFTFKGHCYTCQPRKSIGPLNDKSNVKRQLKINSKQKFGRTCLRCKTFYKSKKDNFKITKNSPNQVCFSSYCNNCEQIVQKEKCYGSIIDQNNTISHIQQLQNEARQIVQKNTNNYIRKKIKVQEIEIDLEVQHESIGNLNSNMLSNGQIRKQIKKEGDAQTQQHANWVTSKTCINCQITFLNVSENFYTSKNNSQNPESTPSYRANCKKCTLIIQKQRKQEKQAQIVQIPQNHKKQCSQCKVEYNLLNGNFLYLKSRKRYQSKCNKCVKNINLQN